MNSTTSIRKLIGLDRDNLLRIYDGEGLRLIPASGVLWITEEQSANDTVLLPGDTFRLGKPGLTLVHAHRTSRVVMELPGSASAPRRVDFASTEGEPGRPVDFPVRGGIPVAAWVRAIGAAIGGAVRAARRLWALGEGRAPAGGWLEHDAVHSSWRVRHLGRGGDAPGWKDPFESAREALARRHPFPYY